MTKVTMPQLGESVVEGTVGKWLVKEGDRVAKDQPLVEILTDKADSELPSPVAGVVVQRFAAEEDTVAVGDPLCEIDETGKASVAKPSNGGAAAATTAAVAVPAASADPGPTSPSVRKLARELGVDVATVRGSGDAGRVTQDDVRSAARGAPSAAVPIPPPSPPPREAAAVVAKADAAPAPAKKKAPAVGESPVRADGYGAFKLPPYDPRAGDEIVPFTRRRRIIADHMVFSKRTSPEVVTYAECDLHATSKLRDANKDRMKKEGANLTFLAFTLAATARALREFPDLNARVLDDSYVKLRDINLGIAVDTPEGLIVPVIRNADELTVRGLARAVDDVAERARTGKVTPDDLAGKTFSVSNPGRRGNLVGGAIISQPNVAILRLGTIKKRPVVIEQDDQDLIAVHPVMYMALTYDHRIVDGVAANGFLYRITEILEKADFEL